MNNDNTWAIFANAHYPIINAFKDHTEYWKNKWCVVHGLDGPIKYVDLLGSIHARVERAAHALEATADLVPTMPVSEETLAIITTAAKAATQAEKLLEKDLEAWAKRQK